MTGSAPAWAVWTALGLWGVAIVAGLLAAVAARRWWRQVRPLLEPYLLAFGFAAGNSATTSAGTDAADSSPADAPDEPSIDGLDVQRAPWRQ